MTSHRLIPGVVGTENSFLRAEGDRPSIRSRSGKRPAGAPCSLNLNGERGVFGGISDSGASAANAQPSSRFEKGRPRLHPADAMSRRQASREIARFAWGAFAASEAR